MPDTLTKADIIEAIQKENGYSLGTLRGQLLKLEL